MAMLYRFMLTWLMATALNAHSFPHERAWADTLRLQVSVTTPSDTEIWLAVRPLSGTARGSVTLPVVQFRSGTAFPTPVTVASTGDRVRISSVGGVDNVIVRGVDGSIEVVESKPDRFWLYQIRTSTDPDLRLVAAAALGDAVELPDMALALSELYRNERETAVRNALLSSYAKQSRGRSGSHPLIVQALNESAPIRITAMRELARYEGVAPVRNAVLDVIRNSSDVDLVNQALRTYRAIVPPAESDDLMRRLLNEDDAAEFAATILDAFQGREEARILRNRLPAYLDPKRGFHIRKSAFSILTAIEKDPSYWRGLFEIHVSDADPLFRMLIWDAADLLAPEDRESFLRSRLDVETDPAVRAALTRLNP
jgi:hypothetical protein